MNIEKPLSLAEAANVVQAVVGTDERPPFATSPMNHGDIGLVLRADGGIEILSIMPDNPDQSNLATLGVRGLFALALFKMAHQTDMMTVAVSAVSHEINAGEHPASKLHS